MGSALQAAGMLRYIKTQLNKIGDQQQYLDHQLMDAITPTVDINIIKNLIERKANVCAKNNTQATALHKSVQYGRKDLAELLLDENAEIDAQNASRWTALHTSIIYPHIGTMELLLDKKADVYKQDYNGQTPLHLALLLPQETRLKICRLLIIDRELFLSLIHFTLLPRELITMVISYIGPVPNTQLINQQDNAGKTALHYAVDYDDHEVMRLLLEYKANPALKTKSGQFVFNHPFFTAKTLKIMQEFFPKFQQGNV